MALQNPDQKIAKKKKKFWLIYFYYLFIHYFRSPNTQSENKYYTLDYKQWNQYNVDWPEYDGINQPYLRIGK